MNDANIRDIAVNALQSIAPEANLAELQPDARIRDQLDIDSMDFLNFIIAIHKELQIEIPERDYPKLATLNGCVRYVSETFARQSSHTGGRG